MSDSGFTAVRQQRSGSRPQMLIQPPRVTSKQLIPHVRALAESLQSASKLRLCREVNLVRCEMARSKAPGEPHLLVAGLALIAEALRRSVNVTLYDVQLLAAIAMSRHCIAQMQTGEGRTFAVLAAALHLALTGRGVHVITPNEFLAERDYKVAAKVAEPLGISLALLHPGLDVVERSAAYGADITYGTANEFCCDYLRDQSALREKSRQRANDRNLHKLRHQSTSRCTTVQRGLVYAVVDEADSVLIDNAVSPVVLEFDSNELAPDADALLTARSLAATLKKDADFVVETTTGRVALTETGVERSHTDDVAIPMLQLVRPWTEYVQQALQARFLFRRGIHFVIQNGEVRVVDGTTGRDFEDRKSQSGLRQAIEASQDLPITAEKHAAAQVTRQRFFRLYDNLSGVAEATVSCERELRDMYELTFEGIPLHVPSQRVVLPTRFFVTKAAKYRAIVSDVVLVRQLGRAVLIGTGSVSDSETLAANLEALDIECNLLYGLQNASEAEIISRAGLPGAVTIATNLAGWGTDIHLHPEVRANGGLHVIVAECQESPRLDRQMMGRCSRQGAPGSTQACVSVEDSLIAVHGPWLADELLRDADENGEVFSDLSPQLGRIQAAVERLQCASRSNMLCRDLARDSLLKSIR